MSDNADADAEEVADEFEALHEIYGVEFERELVHNPVSQSVLCGAVSLYASRRACRFPAV